MAGAVRRSIAIRLQKADSGFTCAVVGMTCWQMLTIERTACSG